MSEGPPKMFIAAPSPPAGSSHMSRVCSYDVEPSDDIKAFGLRTSETKLVTTAPPNHGHLSPRPTSGNSRRAYQARIGHYIFGGEIAWRANGARIDDISVTQSGMTAPMPLGAPNRYQSQLPALLVINGHGSNLLAA